ncbi:MAG: hypothetical protein HY722_06325 [Planctomycetes bacterium]|nr:hypothetical protein [Planctomycetota bacterium]
MARLSRLRDRLTPAQAARGDRSESHVAAGIWVFHPPQGRPKDEARRFVRVFRGAWKRIPKEDRRTLLDYWNDCKNDYRARIQGFKEPVRLPWVELFANSQMESTEALGQTRTFGMWRAASFGFDPRAIPYLSDEGLAFLIAHELSHAFLSILDPAHAKDWAETREDDTDMQAQNWGFDRVALTRDKTATSWPWPEEGESW